MDENISDWAKMFHALGSESRLSVYLILMESMPNGLSMSELQEKANMKPSTLAHHVKFLSESNFIVQEKRSKQVICFANNATLENLCNNVLKQCCTNCND